VVYKLLFKEWHKDLVSQEFVAAGDCVVHTAPESNRLCFVSPISTLKLFSWQSREKWMLQISKCSVGSTKSALFTWTLLPLGNLWIVWPVLFKLLQNWMTQCFTIWRCGIFQKKLCKHLYISQHVQERPLTSCKLSPPMTSFAKLCNSRWRMFRDFQHKNGLKWTKDLQIWQMSFMY